MGIAHKSFRVSLFTATSIVCFYSLALAASPISSDLNVSATVDPSIAFYCPITQGGVPLPGQASCLGITFTGTGIGGDLSPNDFNTNNSINAANYYATFTTNDPNTGVNIQVTDINGGSGLNYYLANGSNRIPYNIHYKGCTQQSTYALQTSAVLISHADSTTVGTNPACTNYNQAGANSGEGYLALIIPANTPVPAAGIYSDTLTFTLSQGS